MTIYFATDHAGFELKNELIEYVRTEIGCEVIDCGATEYDSEDDYPDYINVASAAISEDPHNRKAIIIGGSGQGEAMCANRYPHVRAVVYYGNEPDIIKLSREHNDANILSLGARFISTKEAKKMVHEWLTTPFTHEKRHERRILKLG